MTIKEQRIVLEKGIKAAQKLLAGAILKLEKLQAKCKHPDAKMTTLDGNYYYKAYTYQYCPDCGKGRK